MAKTSQPVSLGKAVDAVRGSRLYQKVFAFSTMGTPINYTKDLDSIGLDTIQSVFIDNSNNSASFSMSLVGTQQLITAPPYSQGFYPILFSGPNITATGSSAGGVDVNVSFLNFQMDLSIWSVLAPGAVTGTVNVSGTVLTQPIAVVNYNLSKVLGTGGNSESLAAATGTRKRYIVKNPATASGQGIANIESAYYNVGGVAGIDDGQSIELLPGESYDSGAGPVPTVAMNWTAATAGHRLLFWEHR